MQLSGIGEAMGLALEEARAALEHDDVPVGAVVLGADGVVLGRGHNAREAETDPTAHAEVVALRAAANRAGSWRLTGATLVVTLEPCTMCAGALLLARLARLVYGAADDKAGAAGSLWDVVTDRRLDHRPDVVAGVRAAECSTLLSEFFAARRHHTGHDSSRRAAGKHGYGQRDGGQRDGGRRDEGPSRHRHGPGRHPVS